MIKPADGLPSAPLTFASLHVPKEQKAQMTQASSSASATPMPELGVKVKFEFDDDVGKVELENNSSDEDVKPVIKEEKEVDVSMQELPEVTTKTPTLEIPELFRQSTSMYNAKADPRLKRIGISTPCKDVELSQIHLSPAVIDYAPSAVESRIHLKPRRPESQSRIEADMSRKGARKLSLLTSEALQGTFTKDFEQFHGHSQSTMSVTSTVTYSDGEAGEELIHSERGSDLNENRSKDIDGQASQACVSLQKVQSRTLKLSEYVKWKKADLNDDLRRLHGLTRVESSPYCQQLALHEKQQLHRVAGRDTTYDTATAVVMNPKTASDENIFPLNSHSTSAKTISLNAVSQAISTGLPSAEGLESGDDGWKRMITKVVMSVLAEYLEPMVRDIIQRKRSLSESLQGDGEDLTGDTRGMNGLHTAKRCKLDLSKSNMATPAVSYFGNHSATVAVIPRLSASSNTPVTPNNTQHPSIGPLIRPFLTAMRSGLLTEKRVPTSFSIKVRCQGVTLSTHVPEESVHMRAYQSILKFLKADDLMGRDKNLLMHSRKQQRWTCLYLIVENEECRWPREGAPGQYACQKCMQFRRPCVVVIEEQMFILPLAPSLRDGTSVAERGFCIVRDGVKSPKASFFM